MIFGRYIHVFWLRFSLTQLLVRKRLKDLGLDFGRLKSFHDPQLWFSGFQFWFVSPSTQRDEGLGHPARQQARFLGSKCFGSDFWGPVGWLGESISVWDPWGFPEHDNLDTWLGRSCWCLERRAPLRNLQGCWLHPYIEHQGHIWPHMCGPFKYNNRD